MNKDILLFLCFENSPQLIKYIYIFPKEIKYYIYNIKYCFIIIIIIIVMNKIFYAILF